MKEALGQDLAILLILAGVFLGGLLLRLSLVRSNLYTKIRVRIISGSTLVAGVAWTVFGIGGLTLLWLVIGLLAGIGAAGAATLLQVFLDRRLLTTLRNDSEEALFFSEDDHDRRYDLPARSERTVLIRSKDPRIKYAVSDVQGRTVLTLDSAVRWSIPETRTIVISSSDLRRAESLGGE